MRKLITYLLSVLVTVLFCLQSYTVKADASGNGELVYQWIADSTYRFMLKFNRDCGADTAPATVPLCMYSSCTGSTTSTTMTRISNTPTTYPYGCAVNKTQCDSPASLIRGFQTWWYSAIVTIPKSCTDWKFYTYGGHRNTALNIQNITATNFYLECTFDNLHFQGNSSPYFGLRSFISICANTPGGYLYNNGAIDPDNDSLVTEIIMPLTGVSGCGNTPSATSFTNYTPSLSITSNPFQTNNTFSLNPATGEMSFTPTQPGNNVLDVRVKEYRNGMLIGSTMREMQIQLLACNSPEIDIILDTNSITGAKRQKDTLTGCPWQPISFCIYAKSSDPTSVLIGVDNHQFSTPAANVSYTNQRTDSVRACLSWTPSYPYDTTRHGIIFTIQDSSCRFGSAPVTYYYHMYVIDVQPHTHIYSDTNLCAGDSIRLKAIGGGSYTWSVLSGTAGSLSCFNCDRPMATPAVTTQYIASTTGNSYCGYTTDTATVTITPLVQPLVGISASPGTTFYKGSSVDFTATVTGATYPTYTWIKNGSMVLGVTTANYTDTFAKNNDWVYCKLHVLDQCAFPADTISNTLTLTEIDTTNGVTVVNSKDHAFKLYPNPARNSFTLGTHQNNSHKATIVLVNTVGQILYSDKWIPDNGNKEINVSSLPDGNYLVLITSNGKVTSIPLAIKH